MKWLPVCCGLFFPWLLLVAPVDAQAVYTAAHSATLQFGAGGLYLRNDYSARATEGAAVWGDYDFSRHFGIEGSVQFGGVRAPDHIGERSYILGPRVFFHRGRSDFFAKFGVGQGTISNQRYGTSSTYNLYSYGAGWDYLISEHINLRLGDVTMERWVLFEPHGLSPLSIVVGVSYVIP